MRPHNSRANARAEARLRIGRQAERDVGPLSCIVSVAERVSRLVTGRTVTLDVACCREAARRPVVMPLRTHLAAGQTVRGQITACRDCSVQTYKVGGTTSRGGVGIQNGDAIEPSDGGRATRAHLNRCFSSLRTAQAETVPPRVEFRRAA